MGMEALLTQQVMNEGYDPEGVFKSAPVAGHIARREINQRVKTDEEFADEKKKA